VSQTPTAGRMGIPRQYGFGVGVPRAAQRKSFATAGSAGQPPPSEAVASWPALMALRSKDACSSSGLIRPTGEHLDRVGRARLEAVQARGAGQTCR
jgi:hypothetical protein